MTHKELEGIVKKCADRFEKSKVRPSVERLAENKGNDGTLDAIGYTSEVEVVVDVYTVKGDRFETNVCEFILYDADAMVQCFVEQNPDLSRKNFAGVWNHIYRTARQAAKSGGQVKVIGEFRERSNKRCLWVKSMEPVMDRRTSLMKDKDFTDFLAHCKRDKTTPLDLMNEHLYSNVSLRDEIKTAINLWMMYPNDKRELLHVGIITPPGQGKDVLKEELRQIVRLEEFTSSSTEASLFGAMDTNKGLTHVGIGLFQKSQHIVGSEIQELPKESFGKLLSIMGNAEYPLNKGQIQKIVPAPDNFLFLGNPPKGFRFSRQTFAGSLKALPFGDKTPAIMSRLTLVYVIESLAKNNKDVRRKIEESFQGPRSQSSHWKTFFKEYLKYVSIRRLSLGNTKKLGVAFDQIADHYRPLFYRNEVQDNRRYGEWIHLVRLVSRINGKNRVDDEDVNTAMRIWMHSLHTLNKVFSDSTLTLLWALKDMTPDCAKVLEAVLESKKPLRMTDVRKKLGWTKSNFTPRLNVAIEWLLDKGLFDRDKEGYLNYTRNTVPRPTSKNGYNGIDGITGINGITKEDERILKEKLKEAIEVWDDFLDRHPEKVFGQPDDEDIREAREDERLLNQPPLPDGPDEKTELLFEIAKRASKEAT